MAMLKAPVYWAKVLGPAVKGTYNTEWSFDIGVDDNTRELLTKNGVAEYIKPCKNPKSGKDHVSGMDYLQFKRRETKANGDPARPYRIVDRAGNDWPQNKKLGNGTVCNIKYAVNEKRDGGFKPSAIAIQVWDYVPYEGEEDFPVGEPEEWD